VSLAFDKENMSFPESSPEIVRWCSLGLALILLFAAAMSAVSAIQAERTGVAFYSLSPRLPAIERATKTESPKQFHQAIATSWLHAFFFGGIAFICFYFHRKLSD